MCELGELGCLPEKAVAKAICRPHQEERETGDTAFYLNEVRSRLPFRSGIFGFFGTRVAETCLLAESCAAANVATGGYPDECTGTGSLSQKSRYAVSSSRDRAVAL